MSAPALFQNLNYTLANEDTGLEWGLLPSGCDSVLAVAGSGARILPLLARHPRKLICVDISREQLHLTRLRLMAARELDWEAYLRFWGYPGPWGDEAMPPAERRRVLASLELDGEAREYLERLFAGTGWQSLLYAGKWERTFAALSRGIRFFLGPRGLRLFRCESLEEQRRFLQDGFPILRWKLCVALFGNAAFFNSLMYRGDFPRKNIPESYYRFYSRRFARLFARGPARENFFLQILFLGRLRHPEGLPLECRPDVFAAAREALGRSEVHYVRGDVIHVARDSERRLDFLSLSDTPSYFSGARERSFLQECRRGLKPGGLIVARNYLHLPRGLAAEGFEDVTADFHSLIEAEKVGVYDVSIFRGKD